MPEADVTELHDLVAAYALDAVDDIERAQFERHLTTCASCRDELSSYGPVLTGLGLMSFEEAPSPQLRTDLLAAIASTPQESPRETRSTAVEVGRHGQHVAAHARPRARSRVVALVAAAAAVIVVVGGGATVVIRHLTQPATQVVASGAQRVLTASDAHSVHGTVNGAPVTFTVSRSQDAAAVVAGQVAAPPSGHTYELWFLDKTGKARSAGLLTKPGTQLMSGSLGDATTAAITVEPAGGSKQPTSKPLVAVTLT